MISLRYFLYLSLTTGDNPTPLKRYMKKMVIPVGRPQRLYLVLSCPASDRVSIRWSLHAVYFVYFIIKSYTLNMYENNNACLPFHREWISNWNRQYGFDLFEHSPLNRSHQPKVYRESKIHNLYMFKHWNRSHCGMIHAGQAEQG